MTLTPEEHSAKALDWFAQSREPLISSVWLITKTHSALGINQRHHGLSSSVRQATGERNERLLQGDTDPRPAVRAGDALRLAVALHSRCTKLTSFDGRMRPTTAVLGMRPALE